MARMITFFRSKLLPALRDDQGGASIMIVGLVFVGLLTMLPLVWNMGAIFTVRRQSQNGSDAAALASAESLARQLNRQSQDWWGCVPPELPQTIVLRYVQGVVVPTANANGGYAAAQQYASTNRTSLISYNQRLHPLAPDGVHAKLVDGVLIFPTHIDVATNAQTRGFLARGMYPEPGPVRARATAETYLDRVRTWETPCPGNPEAIAHHYRFTWKIRLVKTGW